ERSAEVLRDHHVGRQLRPWARHLDVALLEDGLATLALDDGRADVPLDLVVRVHAGGNEVPAQAETTPRLRGRVLGDPHLGSVPLTLTCLLTLPHRPLRGHRHRPPQLPDVASRRDRGRVIALYVVLSTRSSRRRIEPAIMRLHTRRTGMTA